MIPENRLSLEIVRSRFTGARGLGVTKTVDYHTGGIAIQDVSMGLAYQTWRARLFDAGRDTSRALLGAPNTPEFELLHVPEMSEISIAFDQNMRPMLAYVVPGGSHLWWYDGASSGYVTVPVNGITPRIVMDDSRELGSYSYSRNDVILAYKRGDAMYYRQQRDRFTIEYDPAEPLPEPQRTEQRSLIAAHGGLVKIGMTRALRLQFQLEY